MNVIEQSGSERWQSAVARHCLQSGHKLHFDGTRVRDTTSNKRHRSILESWHVKSLEGGLTGETVDTPTQYTPLMQMAKLDDANGWIRWATNNTHSQTSHPHVHNTQREPQHSHNQHLIMPNQDTKPAVFVPRKHKNNNKRTNVLTHTHTTPDHV